MSSLLPIKQIFTKWVNSYNTEQDFQNGNLGLGKRRNWEPQAYMSKLKQPPELIVTQAAIEQKADVVFMIVAGWSDLYSKVAFAGMDVK